MENTYIKPPRTLMEVFQQLPEGTLAQLINNQIVMSPAPSDPHQRIVGEIYAQMHQFVKKMGLGETRVAPYDVYLNRRNAFQPDIIFISNENLHRIKNNGLHGAPDLVIEILSPGTWRQDKEDKKYEYERSGVREYWMIDPADKSTEGFQLVAGEYQLIPSEAGQIPFRLFDFTLLF
jgi:Uma2 family endonuclease